MKSILKYLLPITILTVGISVMGIYLTFYNPLPNYNKDISSENIQNEVTVHRDDYGIPHLFADSKEDLYFAMGYVHAQDRIWQMTLSQMTVEGRFSEFLGDEFLDLDRYLRVLGFQKTAEKIWEALPVEHKRILESYAAGVNTFTSQNSRRLPIEFSLTKMKTITWEPSHSIALIRLMAWEMNTSWWSKAVTGYLYETMTPDDFEQLFQHVPDSALTHEISGTAGNTLIPFLSEEISMRELFESSGGDTGSNAWVADGSVTETGYPLLAGDPHLGMGMPGKWFEVHLNINGQNVSGATLAGSPVIVNGQNDYMAWTLTNVMADDTDFFAEKLHPDSTGFFLSDSLDGEAVYEELAVERSIIKVKDGDEVLNEIRYTENGPIISDIHPEPGLIDQLITMRWTGHEPSNELGVLLGINWAKSFEEYQSLLPDFKVPGMNILYGDISGNIALHVLGDFPQRENPISTRRGWNQDDDWQSSIPFHQLPHVINPDSGWIANANNKVHDDDYPYYITAFWSPSSRYNRIDTLLRGEQSLNTADFKNIQNDIYSNHAQKITGLILPILAQGRNDDQLLTAISYLTNWDFQYATNAAAASILDIFYMKLGENTLQDIFGQEAYSSFIENEYLAVGTLNHLLETSLTEPDTLSDNLLISDDDILNSMKDAVTFLEDSLGTQSYEWRWENLHTVTFKPAIFNKEAGQGDAGTAKQLIVKNILSRGPYPAPGHSMTINKGQYSWEEPFEMTLGASQRRIVDMSDLKSSLSILSTGQSGNPISSHYDDQIELWLNGQYRIFYHHQDEIDRYSNETMTIKPL
ncbi:MAG: penicillin acylase family protein [Balneolales bacterium]